MTNQTDLISEVRASLQAATPGPWNKINESVYDAQSYEPICQLYGKAEIDFENCENNAHLVANAPTWLQQLTDRMEEAVKALEWYADPDKHEIKRRMLGDYAPITLDKGKTAQKALKRIKGD